MNYQAIFFDIDGTLLNDHLKILNSTIKAIKKARQKGIIIGLATGRSPNQIESILATKLFDYAVTYNGQLIIDTTGKIISARPIDKATIRQAAIFAKKNNREIAFGSRKKIIGSYLFKMGNAPISRLISKIIPTKLTEILKKSFKRTIRSWKKNDYLRLSELRLPIYQMMMVATSSEEEKLKNLFPGLKITRSNPYTIDLIPKNGSKFAGLKIMSSKIKFQLEKTVAFGDSDNDLDMLAKVGCGVAMGNADQAVKNVATIVTSSNNQDGIYNALRQLKII